MSIETTKSTKYVSSRKIKPFVVERDSNGCTLLSTPYYWLTKKRLAIRPCCDKHDEWYHYGGSAAQKMEADTELRLCVMGCGDTKFEKKCFKVLSWIVYFAVRVGGSPKLPFPWRWRNNVQYKLEDLKSGYKDRPMNYDEARLKNAEQLFKLAEGDLAVIANDDNTTGIYPPPASPSTDVITGAVVEALDETVEIIEDLNKDK